jgi:excisionase family DNA binding protein
VTASDASGHGVSELEPLLSIDEVARLLRVSESSVYRLVRSGDLTRVKVGGRTLFEPLAVREFIAGCRECPSEAGDDHTTEVRDDGAEAGQHA